MNTPFLIDSDALTRFAAHILRACKMSEADAATVAESLVWADLHGQGAHGVSRLPLYTDWIKDGSLDAGAKPKVIKKTAATFVLDAKRAAGAVAMKAAMDFACDMASVAGVACGAVREASHTGAIGRYAQIAADKGYVALVLAAGPPFMAYHGASVPSLATSPLAIGVPTGGAPMILDMASSVVAFGRVAQARESGAPIPDHWAITADGQPTTDAKAAAVLLPLGGPKGSGLSLMFEALTGILGGAPILAAALAAGTVNRPAPNGLQNDMVIVIDIASFRDPADFKKDADALATEIKKLPRRAGIDEILLPGERGRRMETKRRKDGIPIPPHIWKSLQTLASAYATILPSPIGH